MGLPISAGTDPGILAAATNDIIAIIARRPLFNSLACASFISSASSLAKFTGGKTIVGNSPPFV